MVRTITLQDASQQLAHHVRELETGQEFVITHDGKQVARLVPVSGARVLTPEQQAALARTHTRSAKGWPIKAEPLTPEARAALHER